MSAHLKTATPSRLGRRVSARKAILDPTARQSLWALLLLLAGAALLLFEDGSPAVAWLVIGAVPGTAVFPFLPLSARRSGALGLVSVVLASAAIWTVVIPWMSLLGLGITRISVLLAALVVCLASVVFAHRGGAIAVRPSPSTELADSLGLALTVGIAAAVGSQLAGNPPIGADWGHYWLFADQIARHGTLDALNPIWMGGGMRFSDYPGLPAVVASWLLLAGRTASATSLLAPLLFVFCSVITWATARAWWGPGAGMVAGAASALMPTTITVVGWSGLASLQAVALSIPLIGAVAYLPSATGTERRRTQAVIVGLSVAALLTQPMFAGIFIAGLGIAVLIAVVASNRELLRPVLVTVGVAAAVGLPLLLDYRERLASLGSVQGYAAYLPTRIDWNDVVNGGMLPGMLVALGLFGLVTALSRSRTRPPAVAGLLVILSALLYSQVWRLEVSGEYWRAMYVIGPVLALGFGGLSMLGERLKLPVRLALAALLIGGAAVTVRDWPSQQRDFFQVVTDANWRVAQSVADESSGRSAIVADSCWAFPAVGLEKTKVYGALLPHQIGPNAEVAPAAQAKAVFAGGAAGVAAVKRLGIRWSFVDPKCPTPVKTSRSDGVPPGFIPVAVSDRLIVGFRPSTGRPR